MAFSTLDEWLHWIEQQHPQEIELGLERAASVAAALAIRFDIPVISVAGTNGKGSCVALLSSILTAAGYRCGAYTSPHLLHYNERVCLDGQQASNADLCRAFSAVNQARGGTPLSYFEFGTLAALWLFQQAELDVLILEVGLGGRLDAVNIIDPDVAIVSSVDLDHQAWLGTTREQIGREKAGIFRTTKPAIMGDPLRVDSVVHHAQEIKAELLCRDIDFGFSREATSWHWWGRGQQSERKSYRDLPIPAVLLDNAATVLQALSQLALVVDESAIRQGLQNVSMIGRGESRLYRQRKVRLNVAHNPAALRAMLATLPVLDNGQRRVAIFSALSDKAVDEMLSMCDSAIDQWHILQLHSTPRALVAATIGDVLQGLGRQYRLHNSAGQALAEVVASTRAEDEILVFGSFFTVAEIVAVMDEQSFAGGQQ